MYIRHNFLIPIYFISDNNLKCLILKYLILVNIYIAMFKKVIKLGIEMEDM